MRTKALLGAAVLAVGLSASMAQVYSLNVVGYVNISVTNGVNTMISLPLAPVNGDQTIGNTLVLDNGNGDFDFTTLAIYRGNTWDTPLWIGGAWDNPSIVITNGQGFWLFPTLNNALTSANITMVGQVEQGAIKYTAPVGNWIMSPRIPVTTNWPGSASGSFNSFDNIYQYLGGTWDSFLFLGGAWQGTQPGDSPTEGPLLAPGSAVWYYNGEGDTAGPVVWTQNFTVN